MSTRALKFDWGLMRLGGSRDELEWAFSGMGLRCSSGSDCRWVPFAEVVALGVQVRM